MNYRTGIPKDQHVNDPKHCPNCGAHHSLAKADQSGTKYICTVCEHIGSRLRPT